MMFLGSRPGSSDSDAAYRRRLGRFSGLISIRSRKGPPKSALGPIVNRESKLPET